ncbi:MAG: helix-turn-helix transcriptional regulator [Alphaproteobacteria bacterium]|jgi:transcriptional regulator with XRE-family HTH domain|nr:helix-turn-helix transcriptional regulator [Alphaproteobacteria bacterium]
MEDIKDRLAHILRAKNLTASQFAELMEIQPSNVSHLLNGRNKPSLDFLIKIKEVFPEYSFDWIIMGKKPITINEPNPVNSENQELKFEENEDERVIEFDDIDENYQETEEIEQKVVDNQPKRIESSDIKKVLVVYSDNTFEILTPRYNN